MVSIGTARGTRHGPPRTLCLALLLPAAFGLLRAPRAHRGVHPPRRSAGVLSATGTDVGVGEEAFLFGYERPSGTRTEDRDSTALASIDDLAERSNAILPYRERLNASLAEHPNYRELYRLAKDMDKRGDVSGSLDTLRRLGRLNPRDGRIWRRMSRIARDLGHFEASQALLLKGLNCTRMEDAYLWHGLGELQLQRGAGGPAELDLAASYLRRAAACAASAGDDRASAMAHHSLSSVLERQNRPDDACRTAAIGLRLSPRNSRLVHRVARLRAASGDAKGALRVLDRGLADPSMSRNAHLLHARALCLFQSGDAAAAAAAARRLCDAHPRFPPGWLALAQLRELSGDLKGARGAYDEGIAACSRERRGARGEAPNGGEASWRRAAPLFTARASFAMATSGAVEGRRAFLEGAKALGGRRFGLDARFVGAWAECEADLGNVEFARRLFRRAEALPQCSPTLFRKAAELEASRGRADAARELFLRGAERAFSGAGEDRRAPAAGGGMQSARLLAGWAHLEASDGAMSRARALMDRATALAGAGGAEVPCWLWERYARMELGSGDLLRAKHLAVRAVGAAERAQSRVEQRAAAWGLLAKCAGALGRDAEAEELRVMAIARLGGRRGDGVALKDALRSKREEAARYRWTVRMAVGED